MFICHSPGGNQREGRVPGEDDETRARAEIQEHHRCSDFVQAGRDSRTPEGSPEETGYGENHRWREDLRPDHLKLEVSIAPREHTGI